jgi:hypothetical protein
MTTDAPSSKDLSARIERTQNEAKTLEASLSRALQARQRSVVNGESQLNQARAKKDVDDAREQLADAQQRIGMLREELALASQREAASVRDEMVRAGAALLDKRSAEFEKLEAAVVRVGASVVAIVKLNKELLGAFPEKLNDVPAMFRGHSIEGEILLRLKALTSGVLKAQGFNSSVFEAQQRPSLIQIAKEEQTRVLAQFSAPEPTEPAQAARS